MAFPELAICGYPPEDLVYKKQFVRDTREALDVLAAACPRQTVVVGFVEGGEDSLLYNAAAVIQKGRVVHTYHKCTLPNYSVFDEQRYFQTGDRPVVINVNGLRVAVTICEDLWNTPRLTELLMGVGRFHLLLNISASPFDVDKISRREEVITECTNPFDCAVAYCNLVGGQDELVFDGRSILADSLGHIVTRAKAFDEDLLIADVAWASRPWDSSMGVPPMSTTGILPVEPLEIVKRQGANLPHWIQSGATYAVTFRLADSLPPAVVEAWKREREGIEQRAREQDRELTLSERRNCSVFAPRRSTRF